MTDNPEERRSADRYEVFTSAEMETRDGNVRIAITEDASESGLLLLTRARLEVGEQVRIRIYLGVSGTPRVVEGRVVRRTALPPGASPIWLEEVAVALDTASPDVVEVLRQVGKRQSNRPPPPAEE